LPSWSRDGREIYFRKDDKIMAATVLPGREFATAKAQELLAAPFMQPWYDVTRDGRFLMIRWSEEERGSRQIDLVLNWPAPVAAREERALSLVRTFEAGDFSSCAEQRVRH
jgi:hypothetical protein